MGRLPHCTGRPIRYAHVLYHSQKAEPVDVIVYSEKGFAEPWFLIVPPDSESWLSTGDVVRLYRQRMQIEQCFRDWKSHLGLRGLPLGQEIHSASQKSTAGSDLRIPALFGCFRWRALSSDLESA